MFNYKSTLALGTMLLLPFSVFADTCATLPKCADLGFVNTADECGSLKKLKCPFGDAYFCSTNNCKSVLVGSFEVCTKKCTDDANICVEKRAMTCSEALQKQCGSKVYNDGATISGMVTGNICLKGTVTNPTAYSGSYPEFTQVTVYDAGLFYSACESEMGGKRAKLVLDYTTINGGSFYVDVTIKDMDFYPQNNFNAQFYGNTQIKVNYHADTVWSNAFSPYFGGSFNYGPDEAKSIIRVYCEGGSSSNWSPAYCNINATAMSSAHNVTICGYMGSQSSSSCNGSCFSEFKITCNGQENPSEGCTFDTTQSTQDCMREWAY